MVFFAFTQVALLLYSVCHPSADKVVNALSLISMVFYPTVLWYHDSKVQLSRERLSASALQQK